MILLDQDDVDTRIQRVRERLRRLSIIGSTPNITSEGGWDTGFAINIAPPEVVSGIPAATGACCLNDNSCIVTTEANCETLGGEYQGDGSPCVPNPCEEPTGACCIGENCLITTETDCINSGGTYLGDNTGCEPNPCAGCRCGHDISVQSEATGSIVCDVIGTLLSGSGSGSHTFTADEFLESGGCQLHFSDRINCYSLGCNEVALCGITPPLINSYGVFTLDITTTCSDGKAYVTSAVEFGCSQCTDADPCDPDTPLNSQVFVNDTILSQDTFPGGLPDGETILTDHFEDTFFLEGHECTRILDQTVTINVA